jgi:hypothetical protein
MFGGLGRAVKAFATPDNLMQIGAILKDTSSGGMDNFMNVQRLMQSRQDRQAALDAQTQQKAAIANLLGQFKPDTQTPQMNDLIGQLNQRQAQFGEAPAPMERVKPPSFDMSNPETMGAIGQYAQSGGDLGTIAALQNMVKPQLRQFQTDSGVVTMDEYGKPVSQWDAPVNPLDEAYLRAQIGAYKALEQQRNHAAGKPYFAPPRPAAGVGGGSGAAEAIAAELRRRGAL